MSSREVLRCFRIGILSPGGRLLQQGREGPKSTVPDNQKPIAAATQHGPAR
jgi:hypothetical protein